MGEPLAPGVRVPVTTSVGDREHGSARIGPNAVTQLRTALLEQVGEHCARGVFSAAGLQHHFDHPPTAMIPEDIPRRLFDGVYGEFETATAQAIARRAGRLTADYIIARRIPGLAARLLVLLPPVLAGPLLIKAISRNAWTFIGSGSFHYQLSPLPTLTITGNPLTMPGAAWHVGVFERLFKRLVCAETRVTHQFVHGHAVLTDYFQVQAGTALKRQSCRSEGRPGCARLCLNCTVQGDNTKSCITPSCTF